MSFIRCKIFRTIKQIYKYSSNKSCRYDISNFFIFIWTNSYGIIGKSIVMIQKIKFISEKRVFDLKVLIVKILTLYYHLFIYHYFYENILNWAIKILAFIYLYIRNSCFNKPNKKGYILKIINIANFNIFMDSLIVKNYYCIFKKTL